MPYIFVGVINVKTSKTRILDSLIEQKYGTDEMYCEKTRVYSHQNRLYV